MSSWRRWTTVGAVLCVFGWITVSLGSATLAIDRPVERDTEEAPPSVVSVSPRAPTAVPPTVEATQHPALELTVSARGKHYDVFCKDDDLAAKVLAQAETTHTFMRAWLSMPERTAEHRVSIYICATLGDRRAAERALYWPKPPPSWGWRPIFGYYSSTRAEIFAVGSGRSLRRTIAHEVAHHMVGKLGSRCPTVMDEGIAGYIGTWHSGVSHSRSSGMYEAQLLRGRALPSLRTLVEKTYSEFHHVDERRHYVLARLLVETLANEKDKKVTGRLPSYVDWFDSDRPEWYRHPWYRLDAIYDTEHVEAAWKKRVADFIEENAD